MPKIDIAARDNYAHHYGSMDFSLVWETAIQDVPAVRDFCRKILEAL
ncbi:MAG: hypothetical protein IKP72_05485 [Clostridia bacterium]|nr:hypothetical protein [Clostridia bacterium]